MNRTTATEQDVTDSRAPGAVRGVAWVPGGSSGIGRAVAVELAAMGYTVAVSGRRADAAQAVTDEIAEAGGQALTVPVDVASATAVAVVDQPSGVCVNELVPSPLHNRIYRDRSAYPG